METNTLASVPEKFSYNSTGEIVISVFKKAGVFTCWMAINFGDPGISHA